MKQCIAIWNCLACTDEVQARDARRSICRPIPIWKKERSFKQHQTNTKTQPGTKTHHHGAIDSRFFASNEGGAGVCSRPGGCNAGGGGSDDPLHCCFCLDWCFLGCGFVIRMTVWCDFDDTTTTTTSKRQPRKRKKTKNKGGNNKTPNEGARPRQHFQVKYSHFFPLSVSDN